MPDENGEKYESEIKLDESIESFNAAFEEFKKRIVPTSVVVATKKLALELLKKIVLKTPVDTGRARGNWQLTVNTPATDIVPGPYSEDNTEVSSDVINTALSNLKGLEPFQDVWVTNNVAYIVYLEAGTSDQAPSGMIAISIDEVRNMIL